MKLSIYYGIKLLIFYALPIDQLVQEMDQIKTKAELVCNLLPYSKET